MECYGNNVIRIERGVSPTVCEVACNYFLYGMPHAWSWTRGVDLWTHAGRQETDITSTAIGDISKARTS